MVTIRDVTCNAKPFLGSSGEQRVIGEAGKHLRGGAAWGGNGEHAGVRECSGCSSSGLRMMTRLAASTGPVALSSLTLAWQSLRTRVGCSGMLISSSRWKVCAVSETYWNLSDNVRKKARAKVMPQLPAAEAVTAECAECAEGLTHRRRPVPPRVPRGISRGSLALDGLGLYPSRQKKAVPHVASRWRRDPWTPMPVSIPGVKKGPTMRGPRFQTGWQHRCVRGSFQGPRDIFMVRG